MPTIFLTHIPDMLKNYYGERALAALRKLAPVRLNETGAVLGAQQLTAAAAGCEIIVSDRQTPGPAEFFAAAPDLVAFLRVAVDIRNIDVPAASRAGIPKTRIAQTMAVAAPATAHKCAFTRKPASSINKTSMGNAATSVESHQWPSGS